MRKGRLGLGPDGIVSRRGRGQVRVGTRRDRQSEPAPTRSTAFLWRSEIVGRGQVAGTASRSAWYALYHSMKRGMPTEIGVVGANPMSRWIAEMSAYVSLTS